MYVRTARNLVTKCHFSEKKNKNIYPSIWESVSISLGLGNVVRSRLAPKGKRLDASLGMGSWRLHAPVLENIWIDVWCDVAGAFGFDPLCRLFISWDRKDWYWELSGSWTTWLFKWEGPVGGALDLGNCFHLFLIAQSLPTLAVVDNLIVPASPEKWECDIYRHCTDQW